MKLPRNLLWTPSKLPWNINKISMKHPFNFKQPFSFLQTLLKLFRLKKNSLVTNGRTNWVTTSLLELLISAKNSELQFCQKTPKTVLLITQQPNITQRLLFKTNSRIFFINSYKEHCCSLFTSWVEKQQKRCILKMSKNHPASGVRCAP